MVANVLPDDFNPQDWVLPYTVRYRPDVVSMNGNASVSGCLMSKREAMQHYAEMFKGGGVKNE